MTTYSKDDIIQNLQEIYKNDDTTLLRTLVSKHFLPTNDEKKIYAEIPTPISLVDEMLNVIPSFFWTHPNKVFEPCCGKGNFVLGIFDKFYNGLKECIPDKIERCKVIMSQCLYYGDITYLNVFITTEILKCHIQKCTGLENEIIFNAFTFNSFTGNTLLMNLETEFNIASFDAVIGNPPYNKSKQINVKGGYGGRSLWDKFVTISLDKLLIKKGYLLFVHPPSWRKPEHYLWKLLSNKQILFLKSLTEKEGIKLFNCAIMVDYYLLENIPAYKNTEFYGQDFKTYFVNLSELNFLPSGSVHEIIKILGGNNVIYSRSLYGTDKKNISIKEMDKFNLPVVHNMTKRKGLGFVYSNEDKGQFKVPKVVLSFGRHQYPYNDWEGSYGMSQTCFGLQIDSKEEGDNIVNAINSPKFKEILKFTKWSTFQTDWRMFKEFKKDFWKEII